MYCLVTFVHDDMLSHIRDAKMPKEAWENLKKIFAANTTVRKLQHRQELNNIRQKDVSMPDSAPSDPIEEDLNANSDDDIHPSRLPKDNPRSVEITVPPEPSSDQSTS